MKGIGGRLGSVLIGSATAIVIVTVAIIPFLTPAWVSFEQDRAQATVWTRYTTPEVRTATDAILVDLVAGGDFAVEVGGQPVLSDRERAHMADVRTVFRGLWVLAACSVIVLLVAAARRGDPSRRWRAVRRGALGLTIGIAVVGAVGLVAFDWLFEVFHETFFPAGSYLFDPRTDRLVQLFPFQFWEETAMVVGAAIVALSLLVALTAGRRAGRNFVEGSPAARAAVVEPGS